MKKRIMAILLCVVMLVGVLPATGFAESGVDILGTGSADDPYLIYTAAGLKAFRDKVNGGESVANAKLMNDIVLNDGTFDKDGNYAKGASGKGAEEWTPIGGYRGTFDGNCKTISGLYVMGENIAGLFSTVDNATISDVTVSGYVSGTALAGGIAGNSDKSNFSRCFNLCRVAVSASNRFAWAGGIVGNCNRTTFENCANIGIISVSTTGDNYCLAGGIVGENDYTVSGCYNVGKVTGEAEDKAFVGSIIGSIDMFEVKNSYWLTGTAEQAAGAVAAGCTVTAFEKSKTEFADGSVLSELKKNDTTDAWDDKCGYLAAAGMTLPLLKGQTADIIGSGASDDPYLISTAEELKLFRDIVNGSNGQTQNIGAHAKLMNDIVLNDGTFDADGNYTKGASGADAEKWTPIVGYYGYRGTFDGDGHTIRGLYVKGGEYAGLFGNVYQGAVKNVTVTGYVEGTQCVGGIAGHINYATISGCTNAATVKAKRDDSFINVGGIVGYLFYEGNVRSCTNSGNIRAQIDSDQGEARVGGIAGYLYENVTIADCYNAGSIAIEDSGTGEYEISHLGGIAGSATQASEPSYVSNCYSVGSLTYRGSASAEIRGIIGYNWGLFITNCYWLEGTAESGVGGSPRQVTNTDAHTKADFANGTVLELLKNNRTDSPWDVCGYVEAADMTLPLLKWQTLNARKYDIYISGVQITSLNQNDVLGDGTVSFVYDEVNKKGILTLNGFYSDNNNFRGEPIGAALMANLEIVLIGENKIDCADLSCITAGNLTFSGNGSIELSTDGDLEPPVACKAFTVNSGNVKISSTGYVRALRLSNTLTVNGGTLELISKRYSALDTDRYKLQVILGDDRIMITGEKGDGSGAQATAALDTGTISVAKYIKIFNKYIPIVYNPGQYGTGDTETQNKTYGEDFGLSDALFTRNGYTQVGWALSDGGDKAYELGAVYSANEPLTLYPVWKAEQYSITYDPNGGTINSDNVTGYTYGVGATLPTDVTRAGYTFMGWYDNEGLAGSPVTEIGDAETGDKEYWARWDADTYIVTLNTGGGTIDNGNVTEYTYGVGATLPTEDDMSYTGHTFMGWYDNEGLAGSPVTEIGDAEIGDKAYWARWDADTYTVTLNTGGATIDSGNVTEYTYGAGATLPTEDDMSYTGHTFMGWYDNEGMAGDPVTAIGNSETGNKEYWAMWDINTYIITVKPENDDLDIHIIGYYGKPVVAPTLTRDGYEFIGWDKEFPTTMPAENMTFTALWRDIAVPTGEIKIAENGWKAFLNTVTFGLFFKNTQTVTVTAEDNSGKAVTIEYLLSDKALSESELSSMTFTAYSAPFTINPDNEYVIYAKLTDASGNSAYINTTGIVLDATAPVISGIENGKTYCAAQTVTVTEKYIDTVKVNGDTVTLDSNNRFTLNPAKGEQTVVATDKAGNETRVTVTVNDRHTYEWQSENGQYWQKCKFCGDETAKKDIPTVSINGADKVCRTQDYKFSFTLPEGATDAGYGYEFIGLGDDSIAPTVEDNLYSGILKATVYPTEETGFVLTVYAKTADGFTFSSKKTVTIQNEHSGGTATCTEQAVCEICGERYGEIDGNNHTDTTEWIQTETKHTQKYKCCKAVTVTEEDHEWEKGVCTECHYACAHSGGTATCSDKAVCEICGERYGELDGNNHADLKHIDAKAATATAEGNIEYRYCEGCGKYFADKDGLKEITKADTVTAKLSGENHTTPETGDTSNLALWIALLFISGGVIIGVTVAGKKKKQRV